MDEKVVRVNVGMCESLQKTMKIHCIETQTTMKDYMIGLIKKDLCVKG